jgi:hypothetical protein
MMLAPTSKSLAVARTLSTHQASLMRTQETDIDHPQHVEAVIDD